jgi:H+/Cl- antiporter ClcA
MACSMFLISRQNSTQANESYLDMTFSDDQFSKWELFFFIFFGIAFAYMAHYYLKINQLVHVMMRPYCVARPIFTCIVVAVITAIAIFFLRMYTPNGVRVFSIASDVLSSGEVAELTWAGVPALVGLLITFVTRSCITLLGFNLPIPAGIMVPVFLIGSILGRFVGTVVSYIGFDKEIYIQGYALIGACAFASGVTQTISVAVIAIG